MAVLNFRYLAESRRSISNKMYGRATVSNLEPGKPPIIQQLWVGEHLSNIERLSIRSFLACGHEVHLYTYSETLEAPRGCVVKDAGEIMPESEVFVHSQKTGRHQGSFAGFADLFRWKLIYERGGAWADCDVVCLKPIPRAPVISTELVRVGSIIMPAITNCFFAAEECGEVAFQQAHAKSRQTRAADLQWGEAGTHRMAELVATEGWGDRLAAPSDFCPIPPFRIIDAIAGDIDSRGIIEMTNCYAVHLYNEIMRDAGLDKNGTFPEHGLIGHLRGRVAEMEKPE